MPARTAQSRFVRAVGLSRRKLQRDRAGPARSPDCCARVAPIADVVFAAGYHDQPHLTRSLRELIGHTPAEVARGDVFLAL